MRNFTFPLLAALMLLATSFAGCHDAATTDDGDAARRDSAALHVALMPVADCLPFYYASRRGLFDSLGLDVRLLTLQAQIDTDTALLHRRSHLIYSDLVRAIYMQQPDTFALRVVAAAEGALELVTPRRGRVRSLPQLKEHMVAIARHSITDYWSDRLMDTARLERDDIFRPQINDVHIRTAMLVNGTMDAAFLPEPYATQMVMLGATRHLSTRHLQPGLAAYVAPAWVVADSGRVRQLRLFFRAYDLAAQRLNGAERDSLRPILSDICAVPDSMLDSLCRALPPFAGCRSVADADAAAALEWLKSRGRTREGYTTDTLINNILPERH